MKINKFEMAETSMGYGCVVMISIDVYYAYQLTSRFYINSLEVSLAWPKYHSYHNMNIRSFPQKSPKRCHQYFSQIPSSKNLFLN